MQRRQFLMAASAVATAGPSFGATADVSAYPSRPVTLVVGFSAGGPTDAITRMLAEMLGKHFNQTFTVENRLGANGTIATQYVRSQPPDGHTLLLGSSGPMVIGPNLTERKRYDPVLDFTPVSLVSNYPYFLVSAKNVPVASVKELVDFGKKHKQLSYASAGIGSSNHLAGEWFKAGAGLEAAHIPYKGEAAALSDLIAGRVSFAFFSGLMIESYRKSGQLNVLGVASLRPAIGNEGVPLVLQSGITDFAVEPWTGIFGPAGMSGELVQKINLAIGDVLRSEEAKMRLQALGQFSQAGTPQAFKEFIQTEYTRWSRVIRDAKIQKETV